MSTTSLIRVHATGGPEVLRWEEAPLAAVGPGQARVRHRFAGLNFIDVYHRTGLYPLALPFTPGVEGAGEVLEVGAGVTWLKPGDRVGYAGGAPGAYSVERVMPAERLVALPPAIDDRTAAAMMLKGMTAQMLLRQTIKIEPGDTILVQAAAGGVGLILCQWAHHLGATVIGTVGSDEKAALARAHGCDHTIVYTRESFADRVKQITGGKGVRVAYDSVGKDTFLGSLDCLQVRGLLVLYGQSSGAVPAFDPLLLAQKGCLYVTRPVLFTYTPTRQAVLDTAADLFAVVAGGAVKIQQPRSFPLAQAAEAHRALEGRHTVGSTVLEA
jgi:NADPH2:quinone reductase